MRKLPAVLLAGLSCLPFVARADDPPTHSFTGKVGLFSEYEYRGISQTSEDPALQLNLDYAHKSGLYAGMFFSNIKWLKDTAFAGGFDTQANLEWDIYAGYKFEPIKDWTLDVGYLRYEYPRSSAFNPKPNTDEVYVGVTYGPATLKYSYSFNDTFGVPESEGSDYIELSVTYPIPDTKLSLTAVGGYQRYSGTQASGFNNDDLSYGVYKLGAVYDFDKGFNAGFYWKDTNANSNLYTIRDKNWAKSRFVVFATYSF